MKNDGSEKAARIEGTKLYFLEGTDEELEARLRERIASIRGISEEAVRQAEARQDRLVKVPKSLGRLEKISERIAGISEKVVGNRADRQAVIIMAADNGVVEEGVASAPPLVTLMQTVNFTRRITGIGSQAAYFGIDILDIDIGVKLPMPPGVSTDRMRDEGGGLASQVVNRRIRCGTRNLMKEAAMTRREAVTALLTGFEAADAVKNAGKDIVGVGEMGIGNSTTAAAVISALTGKKAVEVIGRGGGLSDEGLARKAQVVDTAVKRYGNADPIELARSLSGLDICGMAGAYMGAAANRMPAVVDGYISIAGALLAAQIAPATKNYLFTSHRSHEAGYRAAVEKLGVEPMFDLGMKLGEGSGCPIAFKIIEAALAVMNGMKCFEEAGIDDSYLDDLRKKGLVY